MVFLNSFGGKTANFITSPNLIEVNSWYFVIHSCNYPASISYQAIYKEGVKIIEKKLENVGFYYGLIKGDIVLRLNGIIKGLNIFSKFYINDSLIIPKKCKFKKNCNNLQQRYNQDSLQCENCTNNCEFCDFQNSCISCKANYYLNRTNESFHKANCVQNCPFNHIKDNSTFFVSESKNKITIINDDYRVFDNKMENFLYFDKYKLDVDIIDYPFRMFLLFLKYFYII